MSTFCLCVPSRLLNCVLIALPNVDVPFRSVLSGWDNDQREDCLNLLVDKLRECREIHSHPGPASQQLQACSAQLLDTTLELLQVIEDAE